MKGLQRIFQKAPRWEVQYRPKTEQGASWRTQLPYHDPVQAFNEMVAKAVPRSPNEWRVYDRLKKMEVLWPGVGYVPPPKLVAAPGTVVPRIWSEVMNRTFNKSLAFGAAQSLTRRTDRTDHAADSITYATIGRIPEYLRKP